MSTIQDNYVDWAKVQTPSDAAASVNRILTGIPDPLIPEEFDCHTEWDALPPVETVNKEAYENEITDELFTEIAEGDHPLWETAFENEGVVFTGGETLPQKCRKRDPQV